MYEVSLSNEKKLALEDRHRVTRDAHESDRIKAILLRSEGWLILDIAQALRVHEHTVSRYVKDYLKKEKLNFSKGGSVSFLSAERTAELISHLSTTLYHHTHEIVSYIKTRWDITYSIPGLNKWLHQHGFSYKKAKGRPHKANVEQQAEFMKKYADLKSSLPATETLLFIDSVHPTQATKLSYGWIRKGKTYNVSTSASRTRINLIGAIELGNIGNATVIDYETINAKSVENFFETLREKYPVKDKLHIILDQAGYHRAEDLRRKAKILNIELHYLPPYSPNLNPIERLWKVMNEQVRNNYFFSSAKEFREKIAEFFKKTLPKIGPDLQGRINDNFQILNHAH